MEVREVVEEQRGVLREREEERERLSLQVQAAVSGEKDREDQRDRQHREDTASLAILQKQLSAFTNEKYIRPLCVNLKRLHHPIWITQMIAVHASARF